MPLRRFRRLTYAFDSLLGEILLWMIILLLILWALSVVMTYQVADSIAHQPFDTLLGENLTALRKFVRTERGHVKVDFPTSAREMLRADQRDKVYYQIVGYDHEVILGDPEIPWMQVDGQDATVLRYRDDEIDGESVRVAWTFMPSPDGSRHVLIQVAETLKKRQGLAAAIVAGVIVPQFVIVPIALMLLYLALARGITPLQRLQEELRERRPSDLTPINVDGIPIEIRPMLTALNGVMQRLEANLAAQRRFIADAAHQLKTPLTGLRMQTDLALHEQELAPMRERLQLVAQGAENLSHLTQQLLSLARAEATTTSTASMSPIDLRQLAQDVAIELAPRAMEKGVALAFDGAVDVVSVVGSKFLLHELISNLIDNAIKYTPSGGEVSVAIETAPRCAIVVTDTGVGIAPEEREQVFERFYRVLGTDASGSGLGLAIVREIAELHGASIELDAGENDKGTRVRVNFPAE